MGSWIFEDIQNWNYGWRRKIPIDYLVVNYFFV